MLTLDERLELDHFVAYLHNRLRVFGGQVFAFEHGSAEVGSVSGCGVDQAHLHLVPLHFDLLETVQKQSTVEWCRSKNVSICDVTVRTLPAEYLFVSNCNSRVALIGRPQTPTSQWVRRVIADKLERPNEWDYRYYEGKVAIRQTLDELVPALRA